MSNQPSYFGKVIIECIIQKDQEKLSLVLDEFARYLRDFEGVGIGMTLQEIKHEILVQMRSQIRSEMDLHELMWHDFELTEPKTEEG